MSSIGIHIEMWNYRQLLFNYFVLYTAVDSSCSEGASETFKQVDRSGCVCIGQQVVLECCTVGIGSTVFKGSAFNCSSTDNSIILLHSRFSDPGGAKGECNNGSIEGVSLHVLNNTFTSQLTVTISHGMNNKSLECEYDNGTTTRTVGIIPLSAKDCCECTTKNDCHHIIVTENQESTGKASDDHLLKALTISVPVTVVSIIWIVLATCVFITWKKMLHPSTLQRPTSTENGCNDRNKYCSGCTQRREQHHHERHGNAKEDAVDDSSTHEYEICSLGDSSYNHLHWSMEGNKNNHEYGILETTHIQDVDLNNVLVRLQSKGRNEWYQFGQALGVTRNFLNHLDYSNDHCLVEILEYWLKHHQGSPSLSEITQALEHTEIYN